MNAKTKKFKNEEITKTDLESLIILKDSLILLQSTKPQWLERMEAIEKVEEIIKNRKSVPEEYIESLQKAISAQLGDLRSKIIGRICSAMDSISNQSQKQFPKT